MVKKFTLGLEVSVLTLFLLWFTVPLAVAADRINLGATALTAFDWDFLVAQERGFFAQENLDVNISFMAPDLPVKALMAGTVDIAKSGTHFGLIAAAGGLISRSSVLGYTAIPRARPKANLPKKRDNRVWKNLSVFPPG